MYWVWAFPLFAIMTCLGMYFADKINHSCAIRFAVFSVINGIFFNILWVTVCRASTNLIRDALIWDAAATVLSVGFLIILGQSEGFKLIHYVSCFLIFLGIIGMHVK